MASQIHGNSIIAQTPKTSSDRNISVIFLPWESTSDQRIFLTKAQ